MYDQNCLFRTKFLPWVLPFPEAPQGRPRGGRCQALSVLGLQSPVLGIFVRHRAEYLETPNEIADAQIMPRSMNHNILSFMSDLECLSGKYMFH